jgi:rod shape-determining protein MreD
VIIVVALVVQVTVLSRIGLPGAVPDLMLLIVVATALAYGPRAGTITGFAVGLLQDVVPPADHAIGRYAFVLCLVGYLCGLAQPDIRRRHSAAYPLMVVAVAAAAATVLYALLGVLMGDTAMPLLGTLKILVAAVVYDVLIAPFVLPAIGIVIRGRRSAAMLR